MDRRALVLYLQNVRDLEVAKIKIRKMYELEENRYRRSLNEIPPRINAEMHHYDEKPGWKAGAVCGIFGILMIGASIILKLKNTSNELEGAESFEVLAMLIIFFGVLAIIPFFLSIFKLHRYNKNYKKMKNKVDLFNWKSRMQAEARDAEINSLTEKINNERKQKKELYLSEENKAEELLDKFYDMNIIPGRYRLLAAVEYLYDFMSTSQASYTDMLLNVKLEEGIQRLEQRLDVIISEVSDLIYETRCMRKDNEYMINQIIKQNNEMLQSLQRSESNSVEAAQYAQLAVNYSAANAYFSLATYLKK